MIASQLKDNIVYMEIEGELSGADLNAEMEKWAVDLQNKFEGFYWISIK